jgi:hypothetical protein
MGGKHPRNRTFMHGTWRSLGAHLNGVQGVASSNLAVPTNKINNLGRVIHMAFVVV